MKSKFISKYLSITFLSLFSVTSLFIAPNKIFGLESRFETRTEKEDSVYKFRLPGIVISYVNRLYVDPERIKPVEMLKEALSWEERIIPEVLTDLAENTNIETVTV